MSEVTRPGLGPPSPSVLFSRYRGSFSGIKRPGREEDHSYIARTLLLSRVIVMSRDQDSGRIHSIKIDNSSFERVEEFKYLGTTLTNQNCIQEEIKSGLKSGSACYHSVQNLLSSSLLFKN